MIQILTGCYGKWNPPESCRIELDLGCGQGGYLLSLAKLFPERLILGADVMLGRLRKLQKKIDREDINNAQLLRVHAWNLIGHYLPDQSISRIHILCPDPWPKARHRSKRLITSEFLGRLSRKLILGGILHLSTDDNQYYTFMMDAIAQLPCYLKADHCIDDVIHCKTDFELRFEKIGLSVHHRAFVRVN